MPGGLSWAELTAVVSSALRTGGCRSWSVGVYNPDLDPERRAARQIVTFLAQVLDKGAQSPTPPPAGCHPRTCRLRRFFPHCDRLPPPAGHLGEG
jgi:hypothetical protein